MDGARFCLGGGGGVLLCSMIFIVFFEIDVDRSESPKQMLLSRMLRKFQASLVFQYGWMVCLSSPPMWDLVLLYECTSAYNIRPKLFL